MAIIDKPSDYFNTKLYTGTGSELAVTGVGFQPDWIWFKQRDAIRSNALVDSVRGRSKVVFSDLTNAEETSAASTNDLVSFDSDGFTVGITNVSGSFNTSSGSHVAWNWKAGTSFTNDASATGIGSLDSTGSVNTDAGFSIISFAGASAVSTVAHGLGVAPKMMIFKNRSDADHWGVYHQSLGSNAAVYLNLTGAVDGTLWNNTAPTTSVFTVQNNSAVNGSGNNIIAYCFAEKQGYSKFGSYTGNGSTDGTFVYTGFKPAFLVYKKTSATGRWTIVDSVRNPNNVVNRGIYANYTNAEDDSGNGYWDVDFLSNGFKFRTTETETNNSGSTYIYMCFASNPFTTSTGVPATAR